MELEDTTGEGVIHNNMGLAYEMLNNLEQAQEHYEKVLAHLYDINCVNCIVTVMHCDALHVLIGCLLRRYIP